MKRLTLRRVKETTVAARKTINIIHFCVWVFMRACAHARVSAGVCVRVCVCGCRGVGMCLRASSLTYSASNAYAPYFFAAPLAPTHFSTGSHKWHDFRKKVTEHKMCVLIFSITFVWNVSHTKTDSARYYDICEKSSCKVPVILIGL
jgi:hypothetical protein